MNGANGDDAKVPLARATNGAKAKASADAPLSRQENDTKAPLARQENDTASAKTVTFQVSTVGGLALVIHF